MSSQLLTSCRTCLRESLENFFDISKQCYFTQDNLNFCDILNVCTHLKILTNDGLPQRICTSCVQDLQQTYGFLQSVIASDTKLKNLLQKITAGDVEAEEESNSVKDPLENLTDDEEDKSTLNGKNQDDHPFPSILAEDNADNTFEDSLDSSHFMVAHHTDSDKDDSNFLISIESQIFPQGRFKCKLCQKTYFTNVGLQAHTEIHSPKSKTVNKDSSKSVLDRKRYLKVKKSTKHNDYDNDDVEEILQEEDVGTSAEKKPKEKLPKTKKMFPCQVCGKQMISASKLRYHMVMHTGEKDYLCTMCPKAYSTIYALKHHMRAHTGERPYECKFCGDRFLRPTTLKSHMRRHTGERPYGCDICGKRFIQHSSMATHMKLNHMDKTISCPYCDKKYARQTDLNTHLLSHSGDKPFACQMCPSRFTRQSNLNKHMNQHHSGTSSGGAGDNKDEKRIRKASLKKEKNYDELTQQNNDDGAANAASTEHNKIKMENSVVEVIFEKPSCSSHRKRSDFKFTSSMPSDSQIAASTSQVPSDQLNRWNWPNQT